MDDDGSIDEYAEVDVNPSQQFTYPKKAISDQWGKVLEARHYDSSRILYDTVTFSYSYW